MDKFKNAHGNTTRSHKSALRKVNVRGLKRKAKKYNAKKLLAYETFARIHANNLEAGLRKRRGKSVLDMTEQVVIRTPKKQRNKDNVKYIIDTSELVNDTSEDEDVETFDEDKQLANHIAVNLIKNGFTINSKKVHLQYYQYLMKENITEMKMRKQLKEMMRKSAESEIEFDSDKHLARLFKSKLLKSKQMLSESDSSENCTDSDESDEDEMNDEEAGEEAEENLEDYDEVFSEETVPYTNEEDVNNLLDLDVPVENQSPGKFVLLNQHRESEADEKSRGTSSESSDYQSEMDFDESKSNGQLDESESSEQMEDDEIKGTTSGNIENQGMNVEVVKPGSSNDQAQSKSIDLYDESQNYEEFENYEATESIEDMLYDSVFKSNPTAHVQPLQTNAVPELKGYSITENVTIEPIQPKVNGISVPKPQNSVAEKKTEKPAEDVVEILSSDDEDEKPAEKPQQVETNNQVPEETSDDIFNDVQFYMASQKVVVVLKYPTRLYFWGKLIVTSLFGNVCVLGCTLLPSIPYPVYSPRGLGKLYFETIPNEDEFNPLVLFPKLSKTGLSVFDTEQIVTSVTENDVVLLLENNSNVLTNYIHFMADNLKIFPSARRASIHMDDDYKSSLQTYFYKQEECNSALNIGESWYGISNYVFSKFFNAKILVCGGKGVGKSTFNRFLVNSYVNNTPIIYVDLDVGQSEFCISGTISVTKVNGPVFGPSYTHVHSSQLKSRFVRDIDVMQDPTFYLNAVGLLMSELWNEYSDLPWVINTMGFVKTFGESINVAVIKLTRPNFVIQIHDKDPKNNYTIYMRPEIVHNYNHVLNVSLPTEPLNFEHMLIMSETESNKKIVNLEPRQLRELNVISYFSNLLTDDTLYLTDIVPQMAPLASLKIWTFDTVAPNLILNSLNASLVALCKVDSEIETNLEDGLLVLPYNLVEAPICLGFGIVRGINSEQIYILTPLSIAALKTVNCIAQCAQKLPPSMFTKVSPKIKGHIPFVSLKRDRPITANIPKRSYSTYRKPNAVQNSQRE